MEGAPRPRGPTPSAMGYLSLIPILALVGIAFYLGTATVLLSLSRMNYDMTVQPALDFTGFSNFFSGLGPSLILNALGLAFTVVLYAAVPAVMVGYYFALKAPEWLRRLGVFLLLLAWALSFERAVSFYHFLSSMPLAGWFPWLGVDLGGGVSRVLFWVVLPPMSLSTYASFRGFFFGLAWPSFPGSRVERFVREAIPRGMVGLTIGAVLAGGMLFVDPTIPRLFGGQQSGAFGAYIYSTLSQFGYATIAAVAVVVAALVVLAAYAGFELVLLLVRWAFRRFLPRSEPSRSGARDRSLSLISSWVTGLVSGFLLFSLFLPLAVAAVFSFNAGVSFSTFSGWSTRWWTPEPGVLGYASLLADSVMMLAFWSSVGLAAIVAAAGISAGFLAAFGVPYLQGRGRFLVRVAMYFGLVVPLFLVTSMAELRSYWDSLSAPTLDLYPYFILALLPFAAALSFVVTRASLAGPRKPGQRNRVLLWVRTAAAGFLVSLAFVLGSYVGYPGTNTLAGVAFATLMKKIPTLEIDAAVALISVMVLVPLMAAFLLIHDREAFDL